MFKMSLSLILSVLFAVSAFAQKLPPELRLPPDEVVLPGTSAEAKAERSMGYGPKLTKVPEAWAKNAASKGRGVKIAVLDTGADKNHPWISANIKGGYNAINKSANYADGNNHGTHCAGIITEAVPECELYIIKVLSDGGSGSVVDIAHGIDYAVTEFKVDIISLSLGGPGSDSYIPAAFKRATDAGVLIFCAAGNDGPGNNTDGYPARYPQCVSVAACDENKAVARFSSRGASVFNMTPGVQIVSAIPGGKQGAMSGTSMATPLDAAIGATWVATRGLNGEFNKTARPAEFKKALQAACQHPDNRTAVDGYGIPDASKLVVEGGPVIPPPAAPYKFTLSFADLSAAKQAELKAAGVSTFDLNVTGVTKLPTVPVTPNGPIQPPATIPDGNGCINGVCPVRPAYQPVQPSGLFPNFQPFGGRFRR